MLVGSSSSGPRHPAESSSFSWLIQPFGMLHFNNIVCFIHHISDMCVNRIVFVKFLDLSDPIRNMQLKYKAQKTIREKEYV